MPATSVSIRKRTRISQEVRDQIVLEHLPLVKAIAIRVHENLPVHVDLDDLIHAGVLGLFDAVTKYDATRTWPFRPMPNTASRARSSTACDSSTGRRATCASGRSRWSARRATSRSKLGRTPDRSRTGASHGRERSSAGARCRWNSAPSAWCPPHPTPNRIANSPRISPPRPIPSRPYLRTPRTPGHTGAGHGVPARAVPESGLPLLHQRDDHERDRRRNGCQREPHLPDPQTALKKMAVALHSEGIHSAGAF